MDQTLAAYLFQTLALAVGQVQELEWEQAQELAAGLVLDRVLDRVLEWEQVQELEWEQAQELAAGPVLDRVLVLVLARSPHRSKKGQALPCCRD
ncbi:MAG TPA: hypothetical protein VFI90_19980 [Rubrobacter sp.]|nr:hypothetical protein [Rubrobacter sp.]